MFMVYDAVLKVPAVCEYAEVRVRSLAKMIVPVYPELIFSVVIVPVKDVSTVESLVDVPLKVTVSEAVGHVPPQLAHVLQLLSEPASVHVYVAAYNCGVLIANVASAVMKAIVVTYHRQCFVLYFMFFISS
jgi:hypothetical protein